jgi:quinol---cytochrome c reductase iron-sulfur subunit, bacillus type
MEPNHHQPHVPGPSLWPVGFAIGVVVLLVGIVVSWAIVVLGAVLALGFAFLWVRDLAAGHELSQTPELDAETRESPTGPALPAPVGGAGMPEPEPGERYSRSMFLEVSTLGLGAVIGGLVTLPALGFMIGPAFTKQGRPDVDLGPLENFPEGEYIVTTFVEHADQGDVARRTAYIRNNGSTKDGPSFTIISNHCAHLGCPVQPNGPVEASQAKKFGKNVTLVPTVPAGFGCPCHGGQYDTEGNRTAGPPVRALDRYSFSIRHGHLYVGKPFSVSHVEGAGANATITKWTYAFPGEHVDGLESWLYPIQPPH